MMEVIAESITASPHLEYFMHWSLAILQYHGEACKQAGSALLGALRAIHKSVGAHRDALVKLCVLLCVGLLGSPRSCAVCDHCCR